MKREINCTDFDIKIRPLSRLGLYETMYIRMFGISIPYTPGAGFKLIDSRAIDVEPVREFLEDGGRWK